MRIFATCLLALASAPNHGVAAFAFQRTSSKHVATTPETFRQRALSTPSFQLNAESVDSETVESFSDATDIKFEPLGLPARPGRPLKVAIAGGGVGGLTAAYYMLKKVRR